MAKPLAILEARQMERIGAWMEEDRNEVRLLPAPAGATGGPLEGSFSYLLWTALGRPEERYGFMSMYLESAQRFYEARK